jgi:DNA topoisomerase-1
MPRGTLFMAKSPNASRTASTTRKKSTRKKVSKASSSAKKNGSEDKDDEPDDDSGPGAGAGKHLVIVESPAKAKTINRYLGSGYLVKASVGHVRDLPEKAPKGDKSPVPGVDLEHDFEPTYQVLSGKTKTVSELKRAAKGAADIWFATDLDREGEAIAWHLAHILGVDPAHAKRVVFNAITATEIKRAFSSPRSIDQNKVDAQQARRVLDRIVGYQVSPLLWKKVARGLSAGRVQSVAVKVIVEREREIRAFVPDEYWNISARFALSAADAAKLAKAWPAFLSETDEKGNPPTVKSQNAWLSDKRAISADLVEIGGEKFDLTEQGLKAAERGDAIDLTPRVKDIALRAGLTNVTIDTKANPDGKGPSKTLRTVRGEVDTATPYRIKSIETKRTTSRPSAPFITSTLQQAASSRLGFGAQRTMRAAQALYEGVEIKGVGAVGLITYMRTDSTHLSREAIEMARDFISSKFGAKYLPEKPNFFSSSNKAAQEAHEAIRPTSLDHAPERIASDLKKARNGEDLLKLYRLIWERFIACQMTPAQWDSTSVLIEGGKDAKSPLVFKATGRVLAFDGFYRVAGVPTASDEQTLPDIKEGQPLSPFSIDPAQKFTSPPPRYTEASLIKTLESEGIGRPSTYASIIQVIQDRKYVEQPPGDRRFWATDLGEVVTDKLTEAFPEIMEVGYTRELEDELDKIESDKLDWVEVLRRFYGPFKEQLGVALDTLTHAKAEVQPAPKEYRCEKCGADLVYRFGKNGRFLSCSRYPECDYACPCDREGKPQKAETVDIACHKCGAGMTKRVGRFGPFLGCSRYPDCDGILKLDKKGRVVAPQPPPLMTDLACPKDGGALVLRDGVRGPWLSCSNFPKCRGRGKWAELPDDVRAKWEKALEKHLRENPIPVIRDMKGNALTDAKGRPIESEGETESRGKRSKNIDPENEDQAA